MRLQVHKGVSVCAHGRLFCTAKGIMQSLRMPRLPLLLSTAATKYCAMRHSNCVKDDQCEAHMIRRKIKRDANANA